MFDGNIGVVSCLGVYVDAWSYGVVVADGVVGDDTVFAAVFNIDSFFVAVGDDVVGDFKGIGSTEADGFLVHVHAGGVYCVVLDFNVVGVAVSMVDDDAA